MWVYEQLTGRIVGPTGQLFTGYSGLGEGKNNPTEENIRDVGPIPEGFYDILTPEYSPDHGPFAMRLMPDADNTMFGRTGFLMHGDSIEHPGAASEGCIIMDHAARERIWWSGDHRLQVVREIQTKV